MISSGENSIMEHGKDVAATLQRLVLSDTYIIMRQNMLDMIDAPENRVLSIYDVGCGEGALCRDLRDSLDLRAGSQIVGIDSSQDVLDLAIDQEQGEATVPISFLQSSVLDLPQPDDSADIVIFANALKYLKTEGKEVAAAREIGRILRPGGRLLVVDSNDADIYYAGADPEISVQVVSEYAQLQGNPYAGDRIKPLCQTIGLVDIRERVVPLRETQFRPEYAGFAMAQNMRNVLTEYARANPGQSLIEPKEIEEFFHDLETAATNGSYRWQYNKNMVVGNAAV